MRISELIYLKGGERVLRVRLDREEMTIGSDPTSHVMVWDASVPARAAIEDEEPIVAGKKLSEWVQMLKTDKEENRRRMSEAAMLELGLM